MMYIGKLIRDNYSKFENWRKYSNSRKQAAELKNKVIEKKGGSIVDGKMMKKIKSYANEAFGSSEYYPWLVLYAEVRGEFLEGWIPEDYYCFEMIPEFNPQPISSLSTIKSFDHRLFSEFSIQPLGLKISSSFYTADMNQINFSGMKEILTEFDSEVVIKKDEGPSGKEILFKQASEIIEEDFLDGVNYVIQPVVKQHPQIDKLYNSSVNTIRIGTFLTDNGDVEVILSVMRFGKGGSRIDNLVSGGGFISLDKDGKAGKFAYNYFGNNLGEIHPDSGIRFDQIKVPRFGDILTACKKSHLLFPYNRYIAWDVTVDFENKIKFLEWNTRMPAFWCFEATHGPIWDQDSVALFKK